MHGGTSKFEYKYSTPASDGKQFLSLVNYSWSIAGASKYVDVPYALKANEDFDDMRNKVYELQIECDKITGISSPFESAALTCYFLQTGF